MVGLGLSLRPSWKISSSRPISSQASSRIVFAWSDCLKVGRLDASPYATGVIYLKAFWNRSNPVLVGNPVDRKRFLVDVDLSVTDRVKNAFPDQAVALSLRVSQQAIRQTAHVLADRLAAGVSSLLSLSVSIAERSISGWSSAVTGLVHVWRQSISPDMSAERGPDRW